LFFNHAAPKARPLIAHYAAHSWTVAKALLETGNPVVLKGLVSIPRGIADLAAEAKKTVA
jgi:hypothetical protein